MRTSYRLGDDSRWKVKVHPDKGGYPLGHRATVCTPDGKPFWNAPDHTTAIFVALRQAQMQFEPEAFG